MSKYMNMRDAIAEAEAIDTVLYYLNSHPFREGRVTVKQTVDECHWDFDVYQRGLRCGIGEVKCRSRTKEWLDANGYLAENRRVKAMWEEADGDDRTFDCMYVWRTSDDWVVYTMLHWMKKHKDALIPAKASSMKDNHGAYDVSKKGVYVPQWLTRTAGRVGT